MTEPIRLELPADVRYVRLAAACVKQVMSMALYKARPCAASRVSSAARAR